MDKSISGILGARELERTAEMRGFSCLVVSDNGTELSSNAMLQWQEDRQVAWLDKLRRAGPCKTASWKA